MTKTMQKLLDAYLKAERKLHNALDELDECGNDCACQSPSYITLTEYLPHSIDEQYPVKRCLTCGGEVRE